MPGATIPSGPLQDAAAHLGRALLRAHAMGADETLAPMKACMASLIIAARQQGAADQRLARAEKLNDRLFSANQALSQRLHGVGEPHPTDATLEAIRQAPVEAFGD